MRGKKGWYLAAAGLILACACQTGGCRKVTALSLIKDTGNYIAEAKSFQGTATADLSMSFGPLDMDAKVSMNMDAVIEPSAIHMDGTTEIDTMDIKTDTESYTVREGDSIVSYTKAEDLWVKEVSPYEKDGKQGFDVKALGAFLAGLTKDKLMLQDDTQKLGDREVYVLTIDLEKEDLEMLPNIMSDSVKKDVVKDLDLDNLKINTTLKIDKKTKAPAELMLSIPEGLDDMVNGLFDTEALAMTINVNQCDCSIVFDSFGTVDEITVPQEVKEQAREII